MTVRAARQAALAWLAEHAERRPGFRGAYLIGSTVGLPLDRLLPPSSDLDVAVVLDGDDPSLPRGKLLHRGALLEISVFPWERFRRFDELAASYHLAAGLAADAVVADPSGELRAIQREVARSFRDEHRVRARCENAVGRVLELLADQAAAVAWHDQVNSWLFATGVLTHVLLVAALANPTVRLRYVAVRRVVEEYGAGALQPRLLDLLGCRAIAADRVSHHVDALARSFDAAAACARTAFPFRSDITPVARPIAIDGSRALIRSGEHREAVFWIVATFVRCGRILGADAPADVADEHAHAFRELLADLGIRSPDELRNRADRVRQFVPELRLAAEAIRAANPQIIRT
ncbi:MAG TPA: hypothetical protein VNE71_16525 [Myxococcota bacterium]|nr:hypothetical protein [Myxococcota bacterium]